MVAPNTPAVAADEAAVPTTTDDPPPMPAVSRRTAANRANARKSTGPRTAAGKARAAMNAVRHGLTAQTALLLGEDPAALAALADEMRRAHRPAPGLEAVLLGRAVALAWKLRRAAAVEVELVEILEVRCMVVWSDAVELHDEEGDWVEDPGPPPKRRPAARLWADQFQEDGGGDDEPRRPVDGLLLRHEKLVGRLTAQLLGVTRQLLALQKARLARGEEVEEAEEVEEGERAEGVDDDAARPPNRAAARREVDPAAAASSDGARPATEPVAAEGAGAADGALLTFNAPAQNEPNAPPAHVRQTTATPVVTRGGRAGAGDVAPTQAGFGAERSGGAQAST